MATRSSIFPKSNVVHMGDDFVTYGFPFIDVTSGGSIDGMIDGVEKAIAQLPADVKVIPGHGPVSNLDDVRTYIKMLKDTREIVRAALKKHKTLDQMKKDKILDPWKKYSGDFISEDAYLETLYNSLTGSKEGKFLQAQLESTEPALWIASSDARKEFVSYATHCHPDRREREADSSLRWNDLVSSTCNPSPLSTVIALLPYLPRANT